MAKIRIHELAKEINVPSSEIVAYLKEQGADVKNHMSNIEGDLAIADVKQHFGKSGSAPAPAPAKAAVPEQPGMKEREPMRPAAQYDAAMNDMKKQSKYLKMKKSKKF